MRQIEIWNSIAQVFKRLIATKIERPPFASGALMIFPDRVDLPHRPGIDGTDFQAVSTVGAVDFIGARPHFADPQTGITVAAGAGLKNPEQGYTLEKLQPATGWTGKSFYRFIKSGLPIYFSIEYVQ